MNKAALSFLLIYLCYLVIMTYNTNKAINTYREKQQELNDIITNINEHE